ncbi:hypothetical protein BDZ90DRAFT_229389 [Jaminaea rosea]|uniref:DLIC-domain-containing protein n=1 Tax=Jaminaea rosea TaxID=1569628 RepID=A0A316UYJ4_9BASI|nr:hypothetical protein BDZ90DRAFT_229389 [Jaminaea rosea]PWN30369.1 hypothetical protein BDZ90DRAFT_229389 [Jaminaea rosea]
MDTSSYNHNAGDVSVDYSFTRDSSLTTRSQKSSFAPSSSRRDRNTTNNTQTQREDVWSSILLSVRTARSTPTFPIVVLGEPQSGKSTLIRGLAHGCPSGCIEPGTSLEDGEDGDYGDEQQEDGTPAIDGNGSALADKLQRGKRDLGLAYGYCDVPDDEGEDILARLSLYTLSSSDEALLCLLPFALRSPSGGQDAASSRQLAAASSSNSSAEERRPLPSLPTMRDALFLIVLDWQRPQSFLDELRTWISVIKETISAASAGAASSASEERQRRAAQEAMLEEMKDALEAHVRSYVPPTTTGADVGATVNGANGTTEGATSAGPAEDGNETRDSQAPTIVPVSAPLSLGNRGGAGNAALPLDEGVLDDNLGVGIVVVLAKSDHVAQLERDRDFKEEQFDYIQQALRTICLKYGAALFSTAQSRPSSFGVLRQYLVHRLLSSVSSGNATGTSEVPGENGAATASSSRGYPFLHPPSTIERDVLLVPSGWDSWGKIVALREGFHPSLTAQGWEFDCRVEKRRRSRALPRAELGQVERELREESQQQREAGAAPPPQPASACRLWEDVLGDYRWDRSARGSLANSAGSGGAGQSSAGGADSLAAPDAQSFLAQHHATLQKEAAANAATAAAAGGSAGTSDPRAKFARTSSSNNASSHLASAGGRSSIVGPMQSSSLSGPAVERAMGLAQREDSLSAGGADALGSPNLDVPSSSSSRPSTKRRESKEHRSSAVGTGSRPHSPAVGGGTGSTHSSRDSAATRASSPGGASASTKQSEVLQSFFQDLLRGKGGGGAGGGGSAAGSTGASPSSAALAKGSAQAAARRTERGAGGGGGE